MGAQDQDSLNVACPAGTGNQCHQTWKVIAISLLEQLERSGQIGQQLTFASNYDVLWRQYGKPSPPGASRRDQNRARLRDQGVTPGNPNVCALEISSCRPVFHKYDR